jgi:hypothetical protein
MIYSTSPGTIYDGVTRWLETKKNIKNRVEIGVCVAQVKLYPSNFSTSLLVKYAKIYEGLHTTLKNLLERHKNRYIEYSHLKKPHPSVCLHINS